MEDNTIIELFLHRNEDAIAQTEQKYSNYCRSVASGILNDAEDTKEALNDTWLAAWNCIPPHIPERLQYFLGRLTRNICLKMLRSRNAQKRSAPEVRIIYDEIEEWLVSDNSIEAEISAKELSEAINVFLDSITETERIVFVRRYWYMQPIAVIADALGFSESKVKSMLFRTRKKLYTKLRKEGFV